METLSGNQGLAIGRGRASHRRLLVLAFCCLAAMGEGFDLQAPGVTLPTIAPFFNLTTGQGQGVLAGLLSQKSLFLSMSTFGLVIGATLGGSASDRFGRKWVTLVSIALFSGLSVLTGSADTVDMLLICRFVTGLGLGGALPNLMAIVAEHVSLARRGTAVACLYASLPFGGALVSLASSLITAIDWRHIFVLGGVLPMLSFPALFMLLRDERPAAEAVRRPAALSLSRVFFGEGRAPVTLALWLAFFCALLAMYSLLGWLPSLLVHKGLSRPEAGLVQLGFNLFGVAGSVMAGVLIGRRARIAAVYLAAVIALIGLAVAPPAFGPILLMGCFVGGAISGVQAIVYALAPSCYPAEICGTGVGFAVAVGRLGSAFGPLITGGLLASGASSAGALSALVPIATVSGAAAIFVAARAGTGRWRAEPAGA